MYAFKMFWESLRMLVRPVKKIGFGSMSTHFWPFVVRRRNPTLSVTWLKIRTLVKCFILKRSYCALADMGFFFIFIYSFSSGSAHYKNRRKRYHPLWRRRTCKAGKKLLRIWEEWPHIPPIFWTLQNKQCTTNFFLSCQHGRACHAFLEKRFRLVRAHPESRLKQLFTTFCSLPVECYHFILNPSTQA